MSERSAGVPPSGARRGGWAGRMAVRRAAAQWPLLAGVLVVMTLGAAAVGTSALLIGPGGQRSLSAAAARADGGPAGADVVTATIGLSQTSKLEPPGARETAAALRSLVLDALAPLDATVSTWVSTPPQPLTGDPGRRGYLLDADTAAAHATLTAGRWPTDTDGTGPLEVAVPRGVAERLDLAVGDTLRIGGTDGAAGTPITVVGTVELDGSAVWTRDRATPDDSIPVHGPFLVAPGTLLAADAPVGRMSLQADADLTQHADALTDVAAKIGTLRATMERELAGRVDYATARSGLSTFLADARGQLNLTAALVLTTTLLVLTLAGTALTLIARLVSTRRSPETALAADRGASRWQLAGWAAAESLTLAVVATVAGVPLAVGGALLLTRSSPVAEAWSAAPAGTGIGAAGVGELAGPLLIGAVAAGALALALVSTVLAVRRDGRARHGRGRPGAVARSGVDLLLAVLAVLGYLQLRAHRPGLDAPDPVLAIAPVLCLVAAAALTLRVLPFVVRTAEGAARRGRGLAVPLASWQVARGRATTGVFLVVLATASATFAWSLHATWVASQHDQADAELGADVVVRADGSPGQAARLATEADDAGAGATLSPVTHRTIGLGSRPGGGTLVAVDTSEADALLRGRLPGGETWAGIAAGLGPRDRVAGLTVDGPTIPLEVNGTLGGVTITGNPPRAQVTAVLRGEHGERVVAVGPEVPIDGEPHPAAVDIPGVRPGSPWLMVALRVRVSADGDLPDAARGTLELSIRVPGAGAAGAQGSDGSWTAYSSGGSITSRPTASLVADTVTLAATVSPMVLPYAGADVVLAGFEPTEAIPVVCSAALADELDLTEGDPLDLSLASVTLRGVVAGIAPYVPSAPAVPAVLTDEETLSRAMLERLDLSDLVDEWWLASDTPERVAAAVDGTARTGVARDLATGPLRAAGVAALWLLAVTAVLLAAAGTVARELAAAHERTLEVARLRGFGVPRRLLVATDAVRHTIVTALAVVLGTLVGALLARGLVPLLVTSRSGGAPVPPALWVWPWAVELGTVAALLAACLVAGLPAARSVGRGAASAALRMGDAG